MSVYVDEMRLVWPKPRDWRYDRGCHMLADTNRELDAMARKLKLRKSWRHGDHYDLTASKRRQAVAAGAMELSSREMVRLCRRVEKEPKCQP